MRTAKAWVSAAGIVVTALTAALADNVFELNEVATLAAVLVEAGGIVYAVYKIPNKGFIEKPHQN